MGGRSKINVRRRGLYSRRKKEDRGDKEGYEKGGEGRIIGTTRGDGRDE